MKKVVFLICTLIFTILLAGCSIQKKPLTNNGKLASPLPTGESTTVTLFSLINNGKVDEAVNMLGPDLNPDENSKQAWTNNFSNIKSINLKTIEPWEKDSWTNSNEVYKTVLEVQLKVGSAAYGWANGKNTKWIEIDKSVSPWKVDNIATGP